MEEDNNPLPVKPPEYLRVSGISVNVHIYPGEITPFTTRIIKETGSIIRLGLADRVEIVSLGTTDRIEVSRLSEGITVHRVPGMYAETAGRFRRYFTYLGFCVRAYRYAARLYPDVINCHSVHVLPVCVLLRLTTGARLIYDPHELESEVHGTNPLLRHLVRFMEKVSFRFIDALIVVNESIGKWYQSRYGLSAFTAIYNIPAGNPSDEPAPGRNLREIFSIGEDEMLFLYQGLLSEARGLEAILSAFISLGPPFHIVFMGYGTMAGRLNDTSEKCENIHYLPAVPQHELLDYTRSADAGIHLIPNTCLNHYLCLPNKIFEYLKACTPFIVSDLPEMANIAARTGGGWTVSPDTTSLVSLIGSLDKEELLRRRARLREERLKYDWSLEEQKYIAIFRAVLNLRRPSPRASVS
jgi:glycosyltransferase involved in cell wall biosynthesis